MPLVESPKRKTRSPLKERPLRHAGQSVNERLDEKSSDSAGLGVTAWFAIALAGMEWLRQYWHDTYHPVALTVMAVIVSALFGWKIWKNYREVKRLSLGRDGERVVSEFLDQLRKDGYEILHDVVGGDFNVDHVLIGPTGIFAIETKTRSKSGGAEETVVYDGVDVIIHGRPVDPNPVIQAKANARWIRELLKNSTGKDFPVIPIVLFPGWFVERKTNLADALVLNPKNLESVLKSRGVVLPSTDVSLAAFHLKAFIRSRC